MNKFYQVVENYTTSLAFFDTFEKARDWATKYLEGIAGRMELGIYEVVMNKEVTYSQWTIWMK